MNPVQTLLSSLTASPGFSGGDDPITGHLRDLWGPLVDQLKVNKLGTLYGLIRSVKGEGAPTVVLSAHMDTIGLMVSGIWEDFLRISRVGGVDSRVLPGQEVIIWGREKIPGIIALPPAYLLPEGTSPGAVELQHMVVDTGLKKNQLQEQVEIGDRVTFAGGPLALGDMLISGPGLDNRASLAALTLALEEIHQLDLACNLWTAATTAEEFNQSGARVSGFDLQPDLLVVLDVTFGRGPGTADHEAYPLGEGITLGWGPSIHQDLYQYFAELADREGIPWVMEPLPSRSGTDADTFQLTANGIPTMVISIPLRYMHTPVELVDLRDVERAGRLLSKFAANFRAENLPFLAGGGMSL